MINTKRPSTDDYTQVGFVEAKDTQGNYRNIDHIYDNQGNIVFQQGYLNEYQGADNFSIPAIGKPLIDYTIYGNTVQTGTPTPDNPIMPEGCGERTENLFNYADVSSHGDLTVNGTTITKGSTAYNIDLFSGTSGASAAMSANSMVLEAGTYTLSCNIVTGAINIFLIVVCPYTSATLEPVDKYFDGHDGKTFTLTEKSYVSLRIQQNTPVEIKNIMIIRGSQAPQPYEPYGYKIPISSANTTTPVYLGEVETTRKIKKLVLTGSENLTFSTSDANRTVCYLTNLGCAYALCLCTHIKGKRSYSSNEYNRTLTYTDFNGVLYISIEKGLVGSSLETFKAYLAAQYANGTPVTVWYVLANAETAVVNEPLMKIGNYADTLSMEQAGELIPTLNKPNTTVIDVETEVEPSEVDVTYRGSTKPKYDLFLAQNGDSFEAKDGQSLYIGGSL